MAQSEFKHDDGRPSIPVPDPTLRTTEHLLREIAGLKELVFTRIDGMDKAIKLFNQNITRVPTDVDKQISHLKELHNDRFTSFNNALKDNMSLHDEKFRSIQVQFNERDVRTEQTSRDSKVAVDAALQAAKEAVAEQNRSSALAIAKSETSTVKQIDQQGMLLQTATGALNDKIDDIKNRLTTIEGRTVGITSADRKHEVGSSFNLAMVVAALMAGGLLMSVIDKLR
jgi:hypothetical protein